jgi:hypothetical protein
MIMTDQKINDTTPNTLSVLIGTWCGSFRTEHCLDGVDRAGTDVAEHNAESAHHGAYRPGRAAFPVAAAGVSE